MPTEPDIDTLTAEVEALRSGRAFVRHDGWRLVEVGGADARGWLHDLVTADIRTLETRTARRTLILSPTGRIRADLHAVGTARGFVLLQAPDQPEAVGRILAPYVLSSDVTLDDVSHARAAFALVGDGAPGGAEWWAPSVFGEGAGAVTPSGPPADRLHDALAAADLVEASEHAVERWRIERGVPRMGPDFGTDALPAEAGLESAIDFTKGCFLGQESVAKVRNLGHPPRAIVPVRSRAPVRVGMPVLADGSEVGEVTSVAANGHVDAIVRVRWSAAAGELSTAAGPLTLR